MEKTYKIGRHEISFTNQYYMPKQRREFTSSYKFFRVLVRLFGKYAYGIAYMHR